MHLATASWGGAENELHILMPTNEMEKHPRKECAHGAQSGKKSIRQVERDQSELQTFHTTWGAFQSHLSQPALPTSVTTAGLDYSYKPKSKLAPGWSSPHSLYSTWNHILYFGFFEVWLCFLWGWTSTWVSKPRPIQWHIWAQDGSHFNRHTSDKNLLENMSCRTTGEETVINETVSALKKLALPTAFCQAAFSPLPTLQPPVTSIQ